MPFLPWSEKSTKSDDDSSSFSSQASSSSSSSSSSNNMLAYPKHLKSPTASGPCTFASPEGSLASFRMSQKPLSQKQASLLFYEPSSQKELPGPSLLLMTPAKRKQSVDTRKAKNISARKASISSKGGKSTEVESSAMGYDHNLENSAASSMSDDDDDDEPSANTAETTPLERVDDVPTNASQELTAEPVVESTSFTTTSKKQKSLARMLKKSIRHLGDLIKSTEKDDDTSKSRTTTGKGDPKDETKKMKKKKLPETGFYSSNHVLVNRERVIAGITKLNRSLHLDSLALAHADYLAENDKIVHSAGALPELRRLLDSNEVGENVQRGATIRAMHNEAMKENIIEPNERSKTTTSSGATTACSGSSRRRNILRKDYTEFGMATSRGKDGKLYMVQLFRGPTHEDKKKKKQQRQVLTEVQVQQQRQVEEEPDDRMNQVRVVDRSETELKSKSCHIQAVDKTQIAELKSKSFIVNMRDVVEIW